MVLTKFRHKVGLLLFLSAILNFMGSLVFLKGPNLIMMTVLNVIILFVIYFLIIKFYRFKKSVILEGEKKRYDILDDYIISMKESAEYGVNLIPVLISSLEMVVSQTEEAAMTIGSNFGKIVKSSKDGAEEAEAVVDYLLGENESGESDFGQSYLATALSDNKESFKSAILDLKELDDAGKQFLDDIKARSDDFLGETYDNLKLSIKNVSDSITVLSRIYDNISEEISAVIISLQFQDITKQKLEHVINPLLKLNDKLKNVSQIASVGDRLINEWEARDVVMGDLEEMYTMEDERRIMKEVMGSDADRNEGPHVVNKPEESKTLNKDKSLAADDNVELF